MSTPTLEQSIAAQRVGMDALLALSSKALASMRELAELNLQAVNSALAANQEFVMRAMSSNNPQEWFALPAVFIRPTMDSVASYGREVSEIMSRLQSECSATTAALAQQYQREVEAVLRGVAGNRPDANKQS